MLALNTPVSTSQITKALHSVQAFGGISTNAAARVARRLATPVNRAALALEFSSTRGENGIFA